MSLKAKNYSPLVKYGAKWTTDDIENLTVDVDASDVDIADSGDLITSENVEGAFQENRALIDTNTVEYKEASSSGTTTLTSSITIPTDSYTYLVATMDSSNNMHLYINGTEDTNSPKAGSSPSECTARDVSFGIRPQNDDGGGYPTCGGGAVTAYNQFRGIIAEARLRGYEIPQEEAELTYNLINNSDNFITTRVRKSNVVIY
jgi:hypothetical protein